MDPNTNGDGEQKPSFDAEAFKNSVLSENKALMESAVNKVQNIVETGVNTMKSTANVKTASERKAEVQADIREEVDALGLDADGANALLKLVEKAINKAMPDQTDHITKTIDSSLGRKDQINAYEEKIKMKYPQFYDTDSDLRKQTRIEFGTMTEEERKSPAAAWNAVSRAASELGIAPARVQTADTTFVDGDGKPRKDPNKTTKEENDFAAFFGVKADKYKEARKTIN